MTEEEINKIYDRLYHISPKIEPRSIPNPRYISEKIGECHVCIEEVEKFYIKTNKEYSILQRAYNNSESAYAIAKDDLLTNDIDIINLPNQKDREARANNRLKDKINEIKNYKNEIDALKTLLDTINVKFKDLSRLNGDIKLQLRIMEAQIKLGTGSGETEKSLMDELKKTVIGEDLWENIDTKVTEETIMDPSTPITPDSLVWQNEAPVTQPDEDPFAQLEKIVEKEINNPSIPEELTVQIPEIITPEVSSTTIEPLNTDFNSMDATSLIVDSLLINTTTSLVIDSPPVGTTTELIIDSTNTAPPLAEDFLAGLLSDATNNLLTPEPEIIDIEKTLIATPEVPIEIPEEEDEDEKVLFFPEDDVFSSDLASDSTEDIKVEPELDLDSILDASPNPSSNPDPGGEEQSPKEKTIIITEESEPEKTQEAEKQNTNEMSIFTDLLKQFN